MVDRFGLANARIGARLAAVALLVLGLAGVCAPLQAQEEVHYVIQPGDTLIGIARAHFVEPGRWRDLKRLNRVRNDRRLRPGSTLRIPLAWLRQSPAQAEVVRADGEVSVDGRAPRIGDVLLEGAAIATGGRGSLTLRFVDGALVTVQPRTQIRIEGMRVVPMSGGARAHLRLGHGRLENAVSPRRKPGARFEVRTPAAVAAVRGTHYRIGAAHGAMSAEVIEGSVDIVGAAAAAALELEAGFGVRVTAQGSVEQPVALLPAPQLRHRGQLFERVLVRLRIPPVAGAERYRAQIAPDASFQAILHDAVHPRLDLSFTDLPDGDYVLRVRAIDGNGIEGRDGLHRFRLKARPEPPFSVAPADGGRLRTEQVEFAWTAAAEAASYALQVAPDGDFTRPSVDVTALQEPRYTPEHRFTPGRYAWRIASVRSDGERGPWSDEAVLEALPPPAAPEPPSIDDKEIRLRWKSEPGQRFLFQMAADPGFRQLLVEQRLDVPTLTLPRPPSGSYYVRVQATDPDGLVGPFTATQRIDVPQPPSSPWPLLLIPLLLLL